jgi:HSP20 family protein
VIDDLFSRSISDLVGVDYVSSNPAVNILDKNDAYIIELAAPGLKKADFIIKLEKDTISIRVKKEKEEQADKGYKRKEFDYSKFNKSFKIPEFINREKIEAVYKNGVLRLHLAKLDEAVDKGPKEIKIK